MSTDPNELVLLLNNSGLYKLALSVARTFNLPYGPIFESLTKRCGNLLTINKPAGFEWLFENDLQDVKGNIRNPAIAGWNLLQELVEKYEEDKLSTIHQVVCKQIVKMQMWIPQWLLVSYKKRNPAELFRLILNAGRLQEAVEIAGEYIMAALGYGKENYGFTHAIQVTKSPIYLPIRQFIKLIEYLQMINKEDPGKPLWKEYVYLADVLETYLQTSQRISNEMCQYRGLSL